MNKELLLAALISINCNPQLRAQQISTIAGNGSGTFSGNNGPATAAALNQPFNVAVDNAGNLFIADRFNNMVRKVDVSGTITTIAGSGIAGYNGDGIAATDAQLHHPTGVAADQGGSIYIADLGNHRVRKVSPAGIITTIAGNGKSGYNGDDIAATSAWLSGPWGISVDRYGNIFVGDAGNHRVRKITPDGIIYTVAGTGIAGFSGDGNLATAANLNGPYYAESDYVGNLYIADVDNQRIRRVSKDGIISTIAGNGDGGYNGDDRPASSASLFEPIAVAADRMGNIYIADGWNNRIRYVDMHTGIISTVAGNGIAGYNGDDIAATTAQLKNPYGVAVDNSGNLYVADYNNNRVRKITAPTPSGINIELTIFPNPSFGSFAIKVATGKEDKVTIIVSDVAGKKVHEASIESNTVTDFSISLAAGVYDINAYSAGMRASTRLVILH